MGQHRGAWVFDSTFGHDISTMLWQRHRWNCRTLPRLLCWNMHISTLDQLTGTVYRRRKLPFFPQHMVEILAEKATIVCVDLLEVSATG